MKIIVIRYTSFKRTRKIVFTTMYGRHIHRKHILQSEWMNIFSQSLLIDGINVLSQNRTKNDVGKIKVI